MAVRFEDPSIARALAAAGIEIPADTGGEMLPVLIAWSSREALLLRPEYAWLSLLTAQQFLQLPATVDDIRRLLERSQEPAPKADCWDELHTPVGQARWSLGQLAAEVEPSRVIPTPGSSVCHPLSELVAGIEQRGTARVDASVQHLRRFFRQHWPGWGDAILEQIADLTDRGAAERAVECLRAHLDRIAVLEPWRRLFHGGAYDLANKGVGPCKTVIDAYLAGTFGLDDVIEELQRDIWWPRVGAALVAVAAEIARSGATEEKIQDVTTELARLRETHVRIAQLFDDLVAGGRPADLDQTLAQAAQDLATLLDGVREIQDKGQQLRETLRVERLTNASTGLGRP